MIADTEITGLVVTQNSKSLIERAFVSIRKFHPNMKIIVVDGSDKNNDCYKYICGISDENTKVFHVEYNIGHGRGLVFGLQKIVTPFALIFDSDIEMIKSPVQQMLDIMESNTYGIGYTEKTAFDGHEYGCKPEHFKQGWMRYLHPYFCLIQLKEYYKYAPFIHHGAPAVNTCLDIYNRGISCEVIKEFPGLGHSSGKGWTWEGKVREYIIHDTAGTRHLRTSKGQVEIEGEWEPVIKVIDRGFPDSEVVKNGISVITCTGDRPEVFELCKRWISHQTVKPEEWVIIDDGITPMQKPDFAYAKYIRRLPQRTDPKHTMVLNFKEALKYVKCDYIIIMEDDEYYAPNYIYEMLHYLRKYEVVGIGRNKYYHLPLGTYYVHNNMGHASLAQTCFRKSFIPEVNPLIEGDEYLDVRIWNKLFPNETMFKPKPNIVEYVSKDSRGIIFDDFKNTYVGMKGMLGRYGIGSGHNGIGQKDDDRKVLRSWVPNQEDYEIYTSFFGIRNNQHPIPNINRSPVRGLPTLKPIVSFKRQFQPVAAASHNRWKRMPR